MKIKILAARSLRFIKEALRSSARVTEEAVRIKREVSLLPIEEARTLALAAIQDTRRFRVTKSEPNEIERQALRPLAPGLRDLFTEYESIFHVFSDTKYSRAQLDPSRLRAGFIRVATSIDHTELAVLPGEEFLYEIDGTEGTEEQLEGMPSVFHQIVLEERLTAET